MNMGFSRKALLLFSKTEVTKQIEIIKNKSELILPLPPYSVVNDNLFG